MGKSGLSEIYVLKLGAAPLAAHTHTYISGKLQVPMVHAVIQIKVSPCPNCSIVLTRAGE